MIAEDVFAYFAGFVDGDGCFNIRKEKVGKRFKYPCQFIITSTNKTVLEYFKGFFGGSITSVNMAKSPANWKKQFRYTICGKKLLDIIKKTIPYLVEKKKLAVIFCQFCETQDVHVKNILLEKFLNEKRHCDFVDLNDIVSLKNISKTQKPTSLDFAYFAGFIDAECAICLGRYKGKTSPNYIYKAYLICNNTKKPCFFWLMQRFGGSVSFVKKNGNQHNQITWRICSKTLLDLLSEIHPFLKIKQKVCEELIKFKNITLKNGGARHTAIFKAEYSANLIQRDVIFNTIHQLNLRGLQV